MASLSSMKCKDYLQKKITCLTLRGKLSGHNGIFLKDSSKLTLHIKYFAQYIKHTLM